MNEVNEVKEVGEVLAAVRKMLEDASIDDARRAARVTRHWV